MKAFISKTTFKIFQILIAMSLLLYILLKFEITTKGIFNQINNFGFVFFSICIVLTIRPLVTANRWRIFLQYSGIKEKFFQLIKISWVSTFLALFLPFSTGSDIFKMYFIERKYPEKSGFSSGSVIADRMIGFMLFCVLGSIGSLFLPNTGEMRIVKIMIFSLLILIVMLNFIVTNRRIYNFTFGLLNKITFLKFIIEYIINLHKSLTILPYKRILPKVLPFIFIFQICNIFIVYLTFLAVGVNISFFYHLAFLPVIQIITLLPVSFAGLGFREGVFIYFYKFLNVPAEVSFSVSIIYFLITAGIQAFIGGIIILIDKLKLKAP